MDVIEVKNVHFYGFRRTGYQAGEFSLKIDDTFNLEGFQINFSPIQKKIFLRSFPRNVSPNRFTEIWLKEAVSQFCNKEIVRLSSFLDQIGQSEDFLDPPPFVPEGWEENPIAINIDYVELRDIQCMHGIQYPVTAEIIIGDCITFFNVPIYDPTKGSYIEPKFVNNEVIIEYINRLIMSLRANREIELVCAIGHHISTDYVSRKSF